MHEQLENAWQQFVSGDFAPVATFMARHADLPDFDSDKARAKFAAMAVQFGKRNAGIAALDIDWQSADPDAAGLAGAVHFSLRLFDKALSSLARAIEAGTTERAVHQVNLGRALTLLGRPAEALPHLLAGCAGITRQQSLAQRALAETYLALGQIDDALGALPDTFDDPEMIAARTTVLAMSGRHADATHFLNQGLEHFPDVVELLLLAADLAQVRGRDSEAIALLKKALDRRPDSLALWVRLAQSGRRGQIRPDAEAAATKAMALAESGGPEDKALALMANAHILAGQGKTDQAEAIYREALALSPQNIAAKSQLGHLLMETGRIDEAIDCFEQVRATAPLQGWTQLINARQIPDDDSVLDEMERAARRPSLDGPLRSSMLLTVAAAWEKKKDFNRAMRLAKEANDAAKALLKYDPAAHRQMVNREIARFSSAFIDARKTWGHPSRVPVFVVGMPRSGTTLTEQILSSHSAVHGAGELGNISSLIARLNAWERKQGSGKTWPECADELTPRECKAYAQQILDKLHAYAPDAQRVIDKLPHNFEHIGLIKLLLPNAVIFHCRREPRDIAISNYVTDYAAKFGGMGFAYDLQWLGEQLVDHDRLIAHWHQVFPGQLFEVVYEELVEDTEAWARRMIAFLGLDWEPQVLQFQDLERSVKTASVWQVRQPIYTTSRERWRRYEAFLGPLEQALADIPTHPEPLANGAELVPGVVDSVERLKAGDAAGAETLLRKKIAFEPRHAAAHQFLGVALLEQGKISEAISHLRRSVRLHPGHAAWFENLARAFTAAGKLEAAEGARRRKESLARRNPDNRQC